MHHLKAQKKPTETFYQSRLALKIFMKVQFFFILSLNSGSESLDMQRFTQLSGMADGIEGST